MASGDPLFIFSESSAVLPTANRAQRGERNNHPILRFPAGIPTTCRFGWVLPQNYAGGGITIELWLSMSVATSGGADISVAFERIGALFQDIDSDSFAAPKQVTIPAPSTSGQLDFRPINFADGAEMDGLIVGEPFRIEVTRQVDSMIGFAELHYIVGRET